MIPNRYTLANFKTALLDPIRFINEFGRLRRRCKGALYSPIIKRRYGGENFMEKDWDNLIILDACRPEFFREYNNIDGRFEKKVSLGSTSGEFFFNNFNNQQYHDIVYVTGNIHIESIDSDSVHRAIKTYAEDQNHKRGWLPEATIDASLTAYQDYPNKRFVFHFMQPHAPYIGERGETMRRKVTDKYDVKFNNILEDDEDMNSDSGELNNLLEAFEAGYISRNDMYDVYSENVNIALKSAEYLLNHIEGKTVITSDHSESFGDFNQVYGHEYYVLSREIREVPWFVIESDRRRTIAEDPIDDASVDEDVIRENLDDLGYI
jgi:hypothetical protein